MSRFLELLYDVLFHPGAAMGEIARREPVFQGLVVFFVSVKLPLIAVWLGLKATGMTHLFSILIALQVAGSFALWVVGTGMLHLVAELYGSRGTVKGLFAALGFSQLPRIFIVPVWMFASLFPGGLGGLLMVVSGIVVFAWIMMLHVSAIKKVYTVGILKATVILSTPFLATAFLVWMLITFIKIQLFPFPLGVSSAL